MSLINVSNLTFCYDGNYDNIFENVSFQIDTDWKLGLIGRNGRGKTTLLNLFLGKYNYKGKILCSVTFDYFPFEIKDETLNTIDIINNIYSNFELWELIKELSFLNLTEDILFRPFQTLSNGEQTKVLLAIVFLKPNNFLLIDEPTNHLDIQAREIIGDYLNLKTGFILVSHDRTLLDTCTDHILSINKSDIEVQKGNFSSWQRNKSFKDKFEISENEKLKKDIKRLSEAVKRITEWSDSLEKTKIGNGPCDRGYIGHKSAKLMKRSKSAENRQQKSLEQKSKLLNNIEKTDTLAISPIKHHANILIKVENLSIYYDNNIIFNNLNFEIKYGDRVCLHGKNGCGKSSIIKLILGENISFYGNVDFANNLIISYVPQDTSFLKGNLKHFASDNKIDESLFKAILRKLDFSRIQFEKDISDFSNGQKKKVLIAKSLCEKAHLYIWDEPLNFIDILSRIQIENLILEFKPTMLFVEHDTSFINSISTKDINLNID